MAEFTLTDFTNRIREVLYDNFPYESDELAIMKHKNRPLHIRDVAFGNLPTREDGGAQIFEIGSDYAEENYHYYHILEDAEVIRKRGKGNKQSKGSQASVEKLSRRDYGRINFNGKTFSQEYRKNVRGERSRVGKATQKIVGSDGKVVVINKDANYYKNIHYHYIERTLDQTLPFIASEFGLKMGKTQISGLEEEYNAQERDDNELSNIISFMGQGAEGE